MKTLKRLVYSVLCILFLVLVLSSNVPNILAAGRTNQTISSNVTSDIPPFTPVPLTDDVRPMQTSRPLKVYVLSVNQADSTYIEMPDGRNILIDGGQGNDVVKRLKSIGAWGKKIDILVLTHPHIDHVGALLYVLNGCPIKEVWETGVQENDFNPWYSEWRKRVALLKIPDRKVKAGYSATFGNAKLKVLAPLNSLDGKKVPIVNNASIVTEISYGNFKALLTGDAQIEEQSEILSNLSHVQLLKIPHHGAKNAALEATYKKITPDVAVLTTSWWSIPSPYALSLMRKYCGQRFTTWINGTVLVTSDSKTYKVETLK